MTTQAGSQHVPRASVGLPRTSASRAGLHSVRPGRRAKQVSVALAALVVVLAVSGLSYQAISAETDRRAHPAPGRMVDAGGTRLHLRISGEPMPNRPTVILEAGLGGMSSNWAWIQPELAKQTQVVSYDRAGLGWSDGSRGSRDAHTIARQLRTALTNAGVEAPYVAVGHSLGGIYVRAFADLYPDDVAGLVFLDASHPDQWQRFPQASAGGLGQMSIMMNLLSPLAYLGVPRALGLFHDQAAELPAQQANEARMFYSSVQHGEATRDEVTAWEPVSAAQVRAAHPLRDISVAVLSATEGTAPDQQAVWLALHTELASLSPRGTHEVVQGASHVSLITNPEHAMTAARAIGAVVAGGEAFVRQPGG